MLLAIDLGNTNIKYGVFDGDKLVASFRVSSRISRTADEYGSVLVGLLSDRGISKSDIDGIIFSSVIPALNYTICHMCEYFFNISPLIVGPGIKTGLNIKADNPKEVGADIIVNSVSAYNKYGGPIVVIDFGTATTFDVINENFGRIFAELFGGGSARLELTDTEDVLNSGIEIIVSPPGKVIKSLNALSGGEQALVAISIYFAILAHNPSPFCVLDEIEAALDDVNVTRYANYLKRICDKTQFIVITHRRGTMEAADVLYGVTMQEDGISKLLKLDVNNLSPAILN